MKKIILITVFLTSVLLSQHLPLKIGNQWHYDPAAVPGGVKYAAIAVDTTIINNKTYYKIERRHAYTGELLSITFDRFESDHSYYRLNNNNDSLIIDFNWPIGFTRVTQVNDSCYEFNVLHNIGTRNLWGFITESYIFRIGFWCTGMSDTSWVLFSPEIVRMFGCYFAGEGWLVGALIDGTSYGTLYPLPVELVSFTFDVVNNNVQLNWSTATEVNNQGFEIEKTSPIPSPYQGEGGEAGRGWQPIGFVPGDETTTEPQFYSFKDEELQTGKYQYRLKQIDFDGNFEYSKLVEVTIEAPTEYSLEQNYPNPFNPVTSIKYSVSSMEIVTLKVYDILGNEVTTLVNEEKPAGEYEIKFDGTELPSGIYYFQLKAGEFNRTKKMILLK